MEQKPSVGRIVHYTSKDGNTLAAIVNAVSSDDYTRITVFLHDGSTLSGDAPFSAEPKIGHWNWPPRV